MYITPNLCLSVFYLHLITGCIYVSLALVDVLTFQPSIILVYNDKVNSLDSNMVTHGEDVQASDSAGHMLHSCSVVEETTRAFKTATGTKRYVYKDALLSPTRL